MFSKQALVLGVAIAASIVLVHAAPTVNVVESSLAMRGAAPVTATTLEVRSAGEMGEHFDQDELVKRLSLGLYTVNLAVLGAFTNFACQAFITTPPNAITGTFCAAGAIATLGYLIASHWIVAKRDFYADPRHHSNIVLNFPQISGKSATHSMATAFGSIQQRSVNGSQPMLVGYHDCEYSSCYNLFYENYEHPTIGTVHKLSQRPRGSWGNTTKTKRSPQEFDDEQAFEQSETASDGTVIFGTYEYWDTDTADENTAGNGNSGDDVADALFNAACTDADFENQGYFCINIIDDIDGGAVPSTGYFDVTAGENEDDPDNEQSYLETCYDDEFGKKRRARRSIAF